MLASPVPLSEIQNGPVALSETPHGLIRLGSVCAAPTEESDPTSLFSVNVGLPWRRNPLIADGGT
jgi:hypothetical protein